ncbi:MAG: DUF2378 family protein [Sandaracinaceae bacterium]|nr:DUF2378 family protein [Sandaracinaceae bacterium]
MELVPGSPFGPDDPVPDVRGVEDYVDRLDPKRFFVKGMFMQPIADALGGDFDAFRSWLLDPPRGRYVPFRDYPQHDHTRLLATLAERRHPDLTHAEGMRRLARKDFHVFAQSTLGRVILAMVGDARSALHHLPTVYAKVAPGDQRLVVETLDDGRIRIDYRPNHGVYAYQLGQVEEIVRHFGAEPSTEVLLGADDVTRFVMTLGR